MELLSRTVDGFLRQLLLGFGPLLGVSAALYLCIRWTQTLLTRALGPRFVVYWTGWLGTPIHELSHVVVGGLCGLEIVEFKLFAPDERTGVLGYVKYVKPKLELRQLHKVVGTFLMGIAPLFGGAAVIWLAFVLLIHPEADGRYYREVSEFAALAGTGGVQGIAEGFVELMRSVYEQVFLHGVRHWQTWVFLYLTLAVGAHLAPSNADLEGGLVGFLVLCGLGLAANLIGVLAGADTIGVARQLAEWTAPLTTLLLMTLGLNLGNLALAAAARALKAR